MQGTPAGLPCGMPGIGVVMDGAVQHAPQPGRHCTACADVAALREKTPSEDQTSMSSLLRLLPCEGDAPEPEPEPGRSVCAGRAEVSGRLAESAAAGLPPGID